jgi:ketosteroid isomerase-like protein
LYSFSYFDRFSLQRNRISWAAGVRSMMLLGFCFAKVCMPLPLAAQMSAGDPSPAQKAVLHTIVQAFAAVQADDAHAFASNVTPDFYMFDAGKRYDAAALMQKLKMLHDSGTQIVWRVTSPDIHISGNTAWIAYENDGTVTTAEGSTERKWLESAFLVKTGYSWKVSFWHSTRVPTADDEKTITQAVPHP